MLCTAILVKQVLDMHLKAGELQASVNLRKGEPYVLTLWEYQPEIVGGVKQPPPDGKRTYRIELSRAELAHLAKVLITALT